MLELHPEDLKKQWLHRRVGGSLRPSFSSNCLFVSFSIPSLLPFSILSLLPFLIYPEINTSCFIQLVYLAKHHLHAGPVLYRASCFFCLVSTLPSKNCLKDIYPEKVAIIFATNVVLKIKMISHLLSLLPRYIVL